MLRTYVRAISARRIVTPQCQVLTGEWQVAIPHNVGVVRPPYQSFHEGVTHDPDGGVAWSHCVTPRA